MEDQDKRTPESLSRAESSSYDDDDASEDSADSSSESSQDDTDTRRGAFDLFESDDSGEAEEPSLYDLFEQHADPEPPLEDLAPDERVLATDEATGLSLDAANQELVGTEPGSPEEAAAIAGATFNEAVRERLDNDEAPSEETLDAAMNDTAEILGLDSADIPEEDPIDLEELTPENIEVGDAPEETAEVPSEPIEIEADEAADTEPDEVDLPDPAQATPQSGAPAGANPNAAPVAPHVPPVPTHPVPGPGGAGAGVGGGGAGGHHGGGGGPGGPGFGPGAPTPPMPGAPWMAPGVATTLATGNALRHNRRHSHLPYVLAGGVLGYFIGRRRGRIKTEKKLLPVQHRLEQQVGDLQFQLALREAKIRKLAYEKAISHPHIHAALPKRLKELQELQKARLKKDDFERTDKARDAVKKARGEDVAKAGLAAKVAEMASRTSEDDQSAATSSKPAAQTTKLTGTLPKLETTRAKDIPVSELLLIAEQLPIEDRNLRVLYEKGRISQHGLRRVVEAYLRGERFDRILREELQVEAATDLPSLTESKETASVQDGTAILAAAGLTAQQANHKPSGPAATSTDPLLAQARTDYFDKLTNHADSSSQPAPMRLVAVVIMVGVIAGIVLILFLF
jgi:hypothetical protein